VSMAWFRKTWHDFNKFRFTNFCGHEDQILQLAMFPDGSSVASVSADETLQLWRCFTPTAINRKETTDFGSNPTCYKL